MPTVVALNTGERYDFESGCYCYLGDDKHLHFLPMRTVSGCLRILQHNGVWVLDARKCNEKVHLLGNHINDQPRALLRRAVITIADQRLLFVKDTSDLQEAVEELKARASQSLRSMATGVSENRKPNPDPFDDVVDDKGGATLPPPKPAHELAAVFAAKTGETRPDDSQRALSPEEARALLDKSLKPSESPIHENHGSRSGSHADLDEGTVTREIHGLISDLPKPPPGDETPSDGAIGSFTGLRTVDRIASSDDSSFTKAHKPGDGSTKALHKKPSSPTLPPRPASSPAMRSQASPAAAPQKRPLKLDGEDTVWGQPTGQPGMKSTAFGEETEVKDPSTGARSTSGRTPPAIVQSPKLRLEEDGALDNEPRVPLSFSDEDLAGLGIKPDEGEQSTQTALAEDSPDNK